MIRILNGNSFGWIGLAGKSWYEPGRQLIYCGRSHKRYKLQESLLSNPYPLAWDNLNNRYVAGERERACAAFQVRYRTELASWRDSNRIGDKVEGTILVARLYQKIGKVDLVCHCYPKQCHCQFIALAIPWTIQQLTQR